MKQTFLYLLLTCLILISGCKPDKNLGNVVLNWQGNVGTEPLVLSSIYTTGNGNEFYVTKLKFYISHIKLIKEDNSEIEVKDLGFYDAGNAAFKSTTLQVEPGTYKGIKFSVGLDPVQNATDPSDYNDNEVLGPKEDMFWEWLKHRFVILEGRADTSGQNFDISKGLAYHVGTDATYREVTLTGSNFTAQTGSSKNITINFDLLKLFNNAPEPINIITNPATQSESGDIAIALQFANQFSKSFSYSH